MTDANPGDWTAWLADRVAARGVPGAGLCVDLAGVTISAAAGFADLEARAPVLASTVFRLGSITKVLTGLMLVHLAHEGVLDLDSPVADLWPEFALASSSARVAVTTRQLLSHSAGFYGDVPPPADSDGPEALELYARDGARFEQTSAPGARFSYSNAAFALAGRLTEVLTGEVWDQGVVAQILRPLGMSRSGMLPRDLPDDGVATSYVAGAEGLTALRGEPLYRGLGPAGACAWSTAPDLLRLGRSLSEPRGAWRALADQMRALVTPGPTPTFAHGWGLGMARFDDAGEIYGHDGVASGQMAFLRLAPNHGLRLALMTNGGDGRGLMFDVMDRLSAEIGAPILPPKPIWPTDADPALTPHRYVGRYVAGGQQVDIVTRGGELRAEVAAPDGARVSHILRHQADDPSGELFLACFSAGAEPLHQRFLSGPDPDAPFDALIFRGRLLPRRDLENVS